MANENESPTAAWRAAVRERYAADMKRIEQERADFAAGIRRKPINGANWDAESPGLVPPSPRRVSSAEEQRFAGYRRMVAEHQIEMAVDRLVADILSGRKP